MSELFSPSEFNSNNSLRETLKQPFRHSVESIIEASIAVFDVNLQKTNAFEAFNTDNLRIKYVKMIKIAQDGYSGYEMICALLAYNSTISSSLKASEKRGVMLEAIEHNIASRSSNIDLSLVGFPGQNYSSAEKNIKIYSQEIARYEHMKKMLLERESPPSPTILKP